MEEGIIRGQDVEPAWRMTDAGELLAEVCKRGGAVLVKGNRPILRDPAKACNDLIGRLKEYRREIILILREPFSDMQTGDSVQLSKPELCRSCKAPVVWYEFKGGKKAPLDAKPVKDGNIEIIDGLAVVIPKEKRTPGKLRYKNHFASCPKSRSWRKKK